MLFNTNTDVFTYHTSPSASPGISKHQGGTAQCQYKHLRLPAVQCDGGRHWRDLGRSLAVPRSPEALAAQVHPLGSHPPATWRWAGWELLCVGCHGRLEDGGRAVLRQYCAGPLHVWGARRVRRTRSRSPEHWRSCEAHYTAQNKYVCTLLFAFFDVLKIDHWIKKCIIFS